MKIFAIATAGLLLAGSAALAQAPISGTPTSPYPYAAPHEIIDGCRTVYNDATKGRDPVDCSAAMTTGSVGVAPAQPMVSGPGATGSVIVSPAPADPYAAPHEIRDGCRTVYNDATKGRDPVAC